MPFGYLGDTSTKIKQQVKNNGLISVTDNLDLTSNNQSIKLRYTNATKGWQYVYNQTT